MPKHSPARRSLSLRRTRTTNFSRAVRSRRALVELLEARQLLTSSAPVLVPSPFTYGSNPTSLLTIGNVTYFAADDGIHGKELWKTDGTVAGTMLVKDINPGSDDGIDSYYYSRYQPKFINVNGTLFFAANGTHGFELWKSDGSSTGTVKVADIKPGSYGYGLNFNLTNVNGTLFFTAKDGLHGNELWKSDGTAAGTGIVTDINPGSGNSDPYSLTDVNGTLFFRAGDDIHGFELWKSDGTAAGTVMVADINPGSGGSGPYQLTNVNGTLFFTARDGTYGNELWKTDGTAAGTVMVADINAGSGNSYPSDLTNVNGTLFFSADDGTHGTELWKTDGTAAETVMVADINPGYDSSYPGELTNVNGTLFFAANDGVHSYELWKSDGTAAGTAMVADINPSSYGFSTYLGGLRNVNGTLYFSANDGAHGNELWKSDGTAAGTVMVADTNLGQHASLQYHYTDLTNHNGMLLFTADDGIHGTELWKSDGTAAGTVMVDDINATTSYYLVPTQLTAVGGTLFFVAEDNIHGTGLWKTDGTAAGTVIVADTNLNFYSWQPPPISNLTDVNGTLFFRADDGIHGFGLWKSDGTAAGTVMVADINLGSYGYGSFGHSTGFTNVNGTLFFAANDGHGTELWKSDGTAAGTVMVKEISPIELTNVNGTVFFIADDGTHGRELWKSDGTTAGTVMVDDIRPGNYSSMFYGGDFTNVNGTLFFVANDGTNGFELWKSDGSTAGTVMVKDISPGTYTSYYYPYNTTASSSNPSGLINFDKALYFTASDGIHGRELWKSDGTADGTVMVADINPGSDSGFYFGNLTDVNGTLFFAANDGPHGYELWKSDGTAAGTVMVKDIYPGTFTNISGVTYANSSGPGNLTNVNGTLFFSASDGFKGSELWESDGTVSGTVMLGDINPGDGSSDPTNLTSVYGALFFTADPTGSLNGDGVLYYLAPNLIPGDFNGDGHVNSSDIGPAMQALANPSDYETQYSVAPPYLSTIGDVNGDGQFTNADLQRLLYLLRTGGGSLSSEQSTPTSSSSNSNPANQPTEAQTPIAIEVPFVITSNDQAIAPPATNLDDSPAPPTNDIQTSAATSPTTVPDSDPAPVVALPPAKSQLAIITPSEPDSVPTPSPATDTASNSAPPKLTPEVAAIDELITTSSWSDPATPVSSYNSSIIEPSSHHAILAAIDQAFLAPSDMQTRRQRWRTEHAKPTADSSESLSLPPLLAH